MNVRKPTSNNMVKKIEERGCILYEKYKPIKLTAKKEQLDSLILRKHRLTEMFLSKVIGFGWEEVYDIAEEVEHISSIVFF